MSEKNRNKTWKQTRKWTRIYFGTWPKIPLKKVEFFVPICLGFRWLYSSKPFFGNERSCSHEKAIVNKAIINAIYTYLAYWDEGARGYWIFILYYDYVLKYDRLINALHTFAQCLKIIRKVSFFYQKKYCNFQNLGSTVVILFGPFWSIIFGPFTYYNPA